MEYNETIWDNDNPPSISEDNLNKIENWLQYLGSSAAGILDVLGGNRIDILGLYNGTMQNSANTYAITTAYRSNPSKFIPVKEGDEIYVFPLKQLDNNAHYVFGWGAFDNNVTVQSPLAYKGYNANTTFENVFPLKIQSGWNYITLDFSSYVGDSNIPLRTANFDANDFLVVNLKNSVLTNEFKDVLYDIPFEINKPEIILENGATFSASSVNYVHIGANSQAGRKKAILVEEGDYVQVVIRNTLKASGNYMRYGIVTIDANNNYIRNMQYATTNPDNLIKIETNERYLCLNIAEYNSSGALVGTRITDFSDGDVEVSVFKTKSIISLMKKEENKINEIRYNNPHIANGTLNNGANANCIRSLYTIPTFGAKSITVKFDIDFQYLMQVYFRKYSVYTENQSSNSSTNMIANYSPINNQTEIFEKRNENTCIIDVSDCAAFAISVGDNNTSTGGTDNRVLRNAQFQNCFEIYYNFNMDYAKDAGGDDGIVGKIKNARHIPYVADTDPKPLTLVHFSDLHADAAALGRITDYAEEYGTLVDDVICTGDMVANTAVQIASWWKPNVLTVIGNHETASYNSETGYDWTALSMADRDAYYIAPFESNWGIVHTSGKSYYYKDYADSKVRMIVMDGMLYTNAGTEAAEQTTWLGTTMDGAKTLGYDVLIAIHAPHGGSEAVVCSFSKKNQGTMPTSGDCNTPQEVIDVVNAKIQAGVGFIGYIVGHTHQDNIWDCENDGKQRMYCVTCAAVDQVAQWRKSDQFRDRTLDAFNLVTIDTKNKIVKIIRGGGANIDDLMRNRKQISFHYPDGVMLGEDV